jgi:hypothetical protein
MEGVKLSKQRFLLSMGGGVKLNNQRSLFKGEWVKLIKQSFLLLKWRGLSEVNKDFFS